MLNIQDIVKEWTKNNYARYMLTKYGLNYINNLKTPEAWLKFAKYHPPKYICKNLLILGYNINRKDHWENFVFCIKNNLTRNKSIANNSKFREFKAQLSEHIIYRVDGPFVKYAQDRYYKIAKRQVG